MNPWDVARLTVRLGDYNIKTHTEIRHIERRVKRVVRHRGFNARTLYNDIALLTLNEPVPFTEQIRPICLPGGTQLYSGKTATVIGWGSLRESKESWMKIWQFSWMKNWQEKKNCNAILVISRWAATGNPSRGLYTHLAER